MNEYLNVVRNNYANFSGRARRREYWMFALINGLIGIVLGVLDGILGLDIGGDSAQAIGVLGALYSVAVLVPSLAVSIRRMHDVGRSGWWVLIALIPLVGWLVYIVFAVSDSAAGGNKWGPNPKANESATPAANW